MIAKPVYPKYEIDREFSRLILRDAEELMRKTTGVRDLVLTSIDPINHGFVAYSFVNNGPRFVSREAFITQTRSTNNVKWLHQAERLMDRFTNWCIRMNQIIAIQPIGVDDTARRFAKYNSIDSYLHNLKPLIAEYSSHRQYICDKSRVQVHGINIEDYGIIYSVDQYDSQYEKYMPSDDTQYVTVDSLVDYANGIKIDLESVDDIVNGMIYNIALENIANWCQVRIRIFDSVHMVTRREDIMRTLRPVEEHMTNDHSGDDLAEAWRKGFAAHAYAIANPDYKVINPYNTNK